MVTDFDIKMAGIAEKYVCLLFNTSVDLLRSRRRFREMTDGRAICIACMVSFTDMTLNAIGARYNRDHSTAIHAIKKVIDLRDTDPTFRAKLTVIVDYINGECGTEFKISDIQERKDIVPEGTELFDLTKQLEKKQELLFEDYPDVFKLELIRELIGIKRQIKARLEFFNNQFNQ